jgi:Uma2 family endonuclease
MVGRDDAKAVSAPAVKLTYDDFVLFPDDGKRHELIDGEHYVKRRLYERAGLSEYWIVDPEIDVVSVSRLDDDPFTRPIELSRHAGDTLTTPLLPGLVMPLSRIFQE